MSGNTREHEGDVMWEGRAKVDEMLGRAALKETQIWVGHGSAVLSSNWDERKARG